MAATDVRKPTGRKSRLCRPYVAPDLQCLSIAAAKVLLARHADAADPEVQKMIECVDQLQKGS